jgi:hypothetical protein
MLGGGDCVAGVAAAWHALNSSDVAIVSTAASRGRIVMTCARLGP